MKKAALIGFVVLLISSPCVAQKSEGLFTLEKTLWGSPRYSESVGFCDGDVYICEDSMGLFCNSVGGFYTTIFLVGYFNTDDEFMGILFPLIGIGFTNDGMLRKTKNYWEPTFPYPY